MQVLFATPTLFINVIHLFAVPLAGLLRGWQADRRSAMAVEFAMTSMALFAFLLAVVNLGDAGLVLGALQHGAEAGARMAVVQAGVNYATSTTTPATLTCPTSSQVQSDFNSFAAPPLAPATGSTTDGSPVITALWVNGNNNAAYPPGMSLSMTVTYSWKPIGFAAFGAGMTFGVSTVASVMGTSAVTTAC